MTDKVEERTAPDSTADAEKQYPDPYRLYQRWFSISEEAWDTDEGTIGSAELGKLWRRWFEATAGPRKRTTGLENSFLESMGPVWAQMAGELREEMLSEESLPEDPLKFFLRWYNDNSEKWSKAADTFLRKDEVLESVGRFLETYARSHGEIRRLSEESLKRLQIPTRSEVARVAKLVVVVENKVDQIEEAFEEFIHGDSEPATAEAVGSLQERMDRLEDKMDQILAVLEEMRSASQEAPKETSQVEISDQSPASIRG